MPLQRKVFDLSADVAGLSYRPKLINLALEVFCKV